VISAATIRGAVEGIEVVGMAGSDRATPTPK